VSDLTTGTIPFLTLLVRGEISPGQIDDFIDAWHDAVDDDQCSLAAFLGMTDDEYAVITMTPRALPAIAASRRNGRTLHEVLTSWLETARRTGELADPGTVLALETWMTKRHAADGTN